MSWLLAVLSEDPAAPEASSLEGLHPTPRYRFQAPGCYLAAGGLAETCLGGTLTAAGDTPAGRWLVVGVGLRADGEGCTVLAESDWEHLLRQDEPPLEDLDGHFVALRWRPGRLECFTDAIGLRPLYLRQAGPRTLASTRLGWLAAPGGGLEVDYPAFGARWLAVNPLMPRSGVRGVLRLGPGGTARCTAGAVDLEHRPWSPAGAESRPDEATRALGALVRPRLQPPRRLSLGLSGGLDSRVLLAALMDSPAPFALHVFGEPAEPDVALSLRIAADLGLPQDHFLPGPVDPEALLARARRYIALTCASAPASTVAKLGPYEDLHRQGKVVIDGAEGEIARRRFLNRLGRVPLKILESGASEDLPLHLRQHRASIFEAGVLHRMEQGFAEEVREQWASLPPVRAVGRDNFLDLLVVRTRFPYLAAYEQARLDEEVVLYMPFAQPSFLGAALRLALHERRNARLFRKIIRDACPHLARYPLVKGETIYPYRLPTLAASAWMRLKKNLFPAAPARDWRHTFLTHARPFIQDLVHSASVRTYAAYDYPGILQSVTRYYDGDARLAGEVDWWLTFELWRQSLGTGLPG